MARRKFYRTTIEVVVLSEDAPITDSHDLEDIHERITDGDCSGSISVVKTEQITPLAMAKALREQASDPSFFQLPDPPEHVGDNVRVERYGEKHRAGYMTGGVRECPKTGCEGVRVAVRWGDGTVTFPCTHEMELQPVSGAWTIKEDANGTGSPS